MSLQSPKSKPADLFEKTAGTQSAYDPENVLTAAPYIIDSPGRSSNYRAIDDGCSNSRDNASVHAPMPIVTLESELGHISRSMSQSERVS